MTSEHFHNIPCTRHDCDGRQDPRLLQLLGYVAGFADAMGYNSAILESIVALHDHKGILTVTYKGALNPILVGAFNSGWESIVCGEVDGNIVFSSSEWDGFRGF